MSRKVFFPPTPATNFVPMTALFWAEYLYRYINIDSNDNEQNVNERYLTLACTFAPHLISHSFRTVQHHVVLNYYWHWKHRMCQLQQSRIRWHKTQKMHSLQNGEVLLPWLSSGPSPEAQKGMQEANCWIVRGRVVQGSSRKTRMPHLHAPSTNRR